MFKKNKHIKFLITTLALVLYTINTNAQQVDVVNNKGTIVTVNNNSVKTSATESTPADYITNVEPTYSPIENDTYIYTPANAEKVYYVFDGTTWNMIAPTKAARVFYPPSIAIDASTTGTGRTIDLYNSYFSQFNSPLVRSDVGGVNEAPANIPTYSANELYYYVTDYDTTVLTVNSIDANGLMTYSVDAIPTDDNTIINVVFVVK